MPRRDSNNDHCVNVTDLLAVIAQWGTCSSCSADVAPGCSGDGVVNVTDLLAVISAWGACPGYSCDPGTGYDPDDCEGECGHLFGQEYIDCLEECWGLNNP